MKRYKKLQDLADQSLAEYHDETFADEMKAAIEANKKTDTRRINNWKMLLGASLSSVAAVMVIVLSLIFMPYANAGNNNKKYYAENQITIDSDLESLNSDLSQFKFVLDPDVYITKIMDTFYNEILYYRFSINYESGEVVKISVVTNKDYKYSFDYTCDKKADIGTFNLSYCESFESLDADMYYVEAFGSIETKIEKLYLSYSGIVYEENSGFIDYVKQIVETK